MTARVRRGYEKEIKEWLGIPDEYVTACMIPLGFPKDGRRYGPTTRRPAWEVTHWDKWVSSSRRVNPQLWQDQRWT
jgi:nitroreductase